MKIVVLLYGFFPENWSEVTRFILFLDKKRLKKHDVSIIKYRYVLEKLSFYYKGLFMNIGLKSHVLSFFDQKLVKTTRRTYHK